MPYHVLGIPRVEYFDIMSVARNSHEAPRACIADQPTEEEQNEQS